MTAPADRLFILLPVHNRRDTTARFARALAAQTWRDFQLVLVDDGSTDGTAEAVRAILPEVEVLTGTGNWWWGGCLQQAFDWLHRRVVAPDAVVAICNDDMEIAADFLERARVELAGLPGALLLARQLPERGEPEQPSGVHVDFRQLRFTPTDDPARINCLPTRGLFGRWGDLARVGGFHPRLLPHYFSDYEFTIRAGRRGLALRVARTAAIVSGERTTGLTRREVLAAAPWRRPAILLARRYKENPVTWSAFVWLVAPWRHRPWLWLKVWGNSLRLLFARRVPGGATEPAG